MRQRVLAAQRINGMVQYSWLTPPMTLAILSILTTNLLGDSLQDATIPNKDV